MNNVPLGRRNGRSPLGGFLCRWRCENLLLFPPICTPRLAVGGDFGVA
jgi:hypothetical protein